MAHTPGPWRWQGEDYRYGWGWQMLVGPKGEGLIVGGVEGEIPEYIKSFQPIDPALCISGYYALGKPHANPVFVFGYDNARLIAAAPRLLEALKAALVPMGEWEAIRAWEREARAIIAEAEGQQP